MRAIWHVFRSMLELWRHRRLLRELVRRDLRARYKASVLGFLWSLLRPLLSVVIISFVFTYVVHLEHRSFPHVSYFAFLLCGYLPWTFLTGALMEGAQSLVTNAHLIKKVACPRLIFPLAVVLAHLVNTVLAFLVLLPIVYLLIWMGPPLSCVLIVPLLVSETLLLTGLAWGLSVLNVLYRDIAQILEFIVLVWFYVTPIIYSVDRAFDCLTGFRIPEGLYLLNPMATVVYASRRVCLGLPSQPDWLMPGSLWMFGLLVLVLTSILAPVTAGILFKRLETRAIDTL